MLTQQEIEQYRSQLSDESLLEDDPEIKRFRNLKYASKAKITPTEAREIFVDTRPYSEIIEAYGGRISAQSISRLKHGYSWTEATAGLENDITRQRNTGRRSRLTREQILQIFYGAGTAEFLARKFGVAKQTVWKIKMRKMHAQITKRPEGLV